jgi:hypothetical protein
VLGLKLKRGIMGLFLSGLLITTSSTAYANVHVNGYFRKDGTYVQPHYRSNPDGNFYNNWSTKGNINPYTGEEGTKTHPEYNYGGGNYSVPDYNTDQSYDTSQQDPSYDTNQNYSQDDTTDNYDYSQQDPSNDPSTDTNQDYTQDDTSYDTETNQYNYNSEDTTQSDVSNDYLSEDSQEPDSARTADQTEKKSSKEAKKKEPTKTSWWDKFTNFVKGIFS